MPDTKPVRLRASTPLVPRDWHGPDWDRRDQRPRYTFKRLPPHVISDDPTELFTSGTIQHALDKQTPWAAAYLLLGWCAVALGVVLGLETAIWLTTGVFQWFI